MQSERRRLSLVPSRRKDEMSLERLTQAFLTHHRALGHSPATVTHYEDSLKLLFRCFVERGIEPVLDSLTSANLAVFAAWLRETPTKVWRGSQQRSIYGIHGALKDTKAFVRWLLEEEYLDKAPKVPVPRLPQRLFPILTDAELTQVFGSKHLTGESEIAIRNRALLAFMLDTGVRLSEAAGVTLADVSIPTGTAKIRGKGQKERLVFFSEGVAESIQKWLLIRGTQDGPLFWLESSGIRMLFKRIQEDVGLKVFTAHQLRHTSLTLLVKRGVDLHTIKRLAGHASVTTTESYLALAGEDIRLKHQTASPFDHIRAMAEPEALRGRRRLKAS